MRVVSDRCSAHGRYARVGAELGAEGWHVMLEDELHGPMTRGELVELLAHRAVGQDACVWCEGLDEWVPARKIQALSVAIDAIRRYDPELADPRTTTDEPLITSWRPGRTELPQSRHWEIMVGGAALVTLLAAVVLGPDLVWWSSRIVGPSAPSGAAWVGTSVQQRAVRAGEPGSFALGLAMPDDEIAGAAIAVPSATRPSRASSSARAAASGRALATEQRTLASAHRPEALAMGAPLPKAGKPSATAQPELTADRAPRLPRSETAR